MKILYVIMLHVLRLLNNCFLLGTRFDAYQMLNQYRRPVLLGARDIGSWQLIFEIISAVGVITNGALIVFTMTVLDELGWTSFQRVW